MEPTANAIIETIGAAGYARDHIAAVHETTGERFRVNGDDIDEMVDELATMIVAVGSTEGETTP